MRLICSTPILLSVVGLEMFGEFVSLGKLVLTILTGIAQTSHMGLGVISQPGLGGVEMTAGQTSPAIRLLAHQSLHSSSLGLHLISSFLSYCPHPGPGAGAAAHPRAPGTRQAAAGGQVGPAPPAPPRLPHHLHQRQKFRKLSGQQVLRAKTFRTRKKCVN